MSLSGSMVATPAQDAARVRIPGIIMFVFADIASFLLFFLVFMVERARQPLLFQAAERQINVGLGLANTIVLVSSGAFVAAAVTKARRADLAGSARLVRAAIAVGAVFAAVKSWEYYEKLSQGQYPGTNAFFTFYYVLTGLHFIHYAVGMGALILVHHKLVRASPQHFLWLQSCALYWHMVDIIWIFLFPILYLQGAR